MADNAPFSVQRPPFPNVVCQMNRRVKMHVATITGANGSASVNTSRSSAGITVTYVGEGNYTVGFPAGGTGAIGWTVITPPQVPGETVTDTKFFAIDSDIVNYATGTLRFTCVDGSATSAVSDVIGDITLMIYVVEA